MENVELEWYSDFELAWDRDDPYWGMEFDVYFDEEDIKIINIPKEESMIPEDERKEMIKKVNDNPERYHLIKPLTHFEHHDIFNEYLETIDSDICQKCNTKSIGGFKDDLFNIFSNKTYEKVWYGWFDFRNKALKKRAGDWLKKFGYNVTWV